MLNDDYSLCPPPSNFGAWQSDRDRVPRESDVVSGRMHLVEQCDVIEPAPGLVSFVKAFGQLRKGEVRPSFTPMSGMCAREILSVCPCMCA